MPAVVNKIVKCTECGEKIIRLVLNHASQPLKSDACPHSTQQPPTQERIFYCRLSPAIPSVRPFILRLYTHEQFAMRNKREAALLASCPLSLSWLFISDFMARNNPCPLQCIENGRVWEIDIGYITVDVRYSLDLYSQQFSQSPKYPL